MKSNDKHEIQKAIKEYIDSIGEDKIEKYHVSDMELTYKQLVMIFLRRLVCIAREMMSLKLKLT